MLAAAILGGGCASPAKPHWSTLPSDGPDMPVHVWEQKLREMEAEANTQALAQPERNQAQKP